MPAAARTRARRDSIPEEFPGFDQGSQPAEEDYPGYAHVEEMPETETLATTTLVLGILSVVLLPLGLVFGLAALLVAPRARHRIRSGDGMLEGMGLIGAGTVFGLVGIVLWVLAVAVGVAVSVL